MMKVPSNRCSSSTATPPTWMWWWLLWWWWWEIVLSFHGLVVVQAMDTYAYDLFLPLLLPIVLPYFFLDCVLFEPCSRRRQLELLSSQDKVQEKEMLFWIEAMESCFTVEYTMILVVDRQSGHLLVSAQPDSTSLDDNDVCFPMIIHTTQRVENEKTNKKKNGDFQFQLYTYDPQDMEGLVNFSSSTSTTRIVDYDLNAKRTLKDILQAIHVVTLEQEEEQNTSTFTSGASLYSDGIVPMNCATYLELGKQLEIPIHSNLLYFVVQSMKDSTYVETTIRTNPIFQRLGDTGWLGSNNSDDHVAVRRHLENDDTLGNGPWDPQHLLRRYGEYMLEQQQYPKELLHK